MEGIKNRKAPDHWIKHQLIFPKTVNSFDVDILFGGYVVTTDIWKQLHPLYASYSRLYYITEGSGVLFSENEELKLEPGYVYLAPCGVKVGYYGTPSITKLFFHVNLALYPGGCDVFEEYRHLARLPRSVEHIEKLKEWCLGKSNYEYFLVKSEIYRTLSEFLTLNEISDISEKMHSHTVSSAIAYIRSHLSASLKVETVAKAVHVSRSKLASLFREEMHQPVSLYIDELVMSEAQWLLLYSDLGIGEISERLGFCDQFYFSKKFSKRFLISPRDFKKY